jgi:hypothetical protein
MINALKQINAAQVVILGGCIITLLAVLGTIYLTLC